MRNYREVADRVLARSDQIRARRRRRARWLTSLGAAGACLALLLVWKPWALAQSEAQFTPDQMMQPGQTDVVGPSQEPQDPRNTGTTQTAPQSQTETGAPPSSSEGPSAIGGPMIGPGDPSFPQDEPMEMIASFGQGGQSAACYAAPENGQVGYSIPLRGAMEEYGQSRRYQVYVDVFVDGVQQPQDGAWVQGEMDRLFGLGYIVAYETYFDGQQNHYAFTLHASWEQLANFPAAAGYGYFFFLYRERI